MSVSEIGFRCRRAAQVRAEHLLVNAGWKPTAHAGYQDGPPLLADISGLLAGVDQDELAALDRYCKGTLSMFGRHWEVGTDIHWNTDPKTGIAAPLTFGKQIDYRDARHFGDCKTLWELGRFTMSVPLALGYARTLDSRYSEKLGRDIDSWVAQCPFATGPHWVSSLELALRLIAWSLTHEILRQACVPGGLFGVVRDPAALEHAIFEQCWFIRSFLSEYSSANNHLIGELTGLAIASTVFRFGPQSEKWQAYAFDRLQAEFIAQNHDDGVNREQAVYYHLWVLEYLLLAIGLAFRSGNTWRAEFSELAAKMLNFVLVLSSEDTREPPHIGDSDDGRAVVLSASESANAFAWVWELDKPRSACRRSTLYRGLLGPVFEEVVTRMVRPRSEAEGLMRYSSGGYCIFYAPDYRVVFDTGPLGYGPIAAHGHADCLSVCLQYGGLWWLADPGTYEYHTDPAWRDHFRQTESHNTLTVDGLNQSEIGGPFLWLRKAEASGFTTEASDGMYRAAARHDGYAQLGIVHQREVEVGKHSVRITDSVTGTGRHWVAIHFQLHELLDVALDPDRSTVTAAHAGRLMTLQYAPWLKAALYTGSETPRAGWRSDQLGIKVPAPLLRLSGQFELPVRLTTQIYLS